MQVNFNLTNLFRFVRVNPSNNETASNSNFSLANASQQDITQRNLNDRRIHQVQATLADIDELLARSNVSTSIGKARAFSTAAMGLNTIGTTTTMDSTEEINTVSTSYTPFGPTFTGSGLSTALPELSGTYNGDGGEQQLRFLVTRTGVHGESRIDIKVYDENEDKIRTIKVQPWHAEDRVYSVKWGIQFTLGPGTLIKNDEFFLDISDTTPSSVSPDNPFNGTRNDRPNFDPGESVSAGTFEINGAVIAVADDDTINSVLQKINSSSANVTAVFDQASERVKLTNNQVGSTDIVIENDTSGFVSASKLTGSAVLGQDREADAVLSSTNRFSAVTSGNLRINSNNIAFDVASDSLTDIIQRINDADIGVTATLVSEQKVSIKADIEGMPLTLDDDGTGLFDALNIVEKKYEAKIRTGAPRQRTYDIANKLERSVRYLNEIFDPLTNDNSASPSLAKLRGSLLAAFRNEAPEGSTALGLSFALDAPLRRNMIDVDRRELTQYARRNATSFGLGLAGFSSSIRGAIGAYQAQFGGSDSGVMVNTRA
ncbi:MAG: hypothetical protein HKN49_00460 [Gammaproteobacteria bacterium]|nr:hypothetical protein [Gammaproteobacteria bacterium]